MSIIMLSKWGNSAGIRIPAHDLKTSGVSIGDQVELTINPQGGFTLTPIKNPQEGWLEAFNAIADADEDMMLISDLETDFDKDEWTW